MAYTNGNTRKTNTTRNTKRQQQREQNRNTKRQQPRTHALRLYYNGDLIAGIDADLDGVNLLCEDILENRVEHFDADLVDILDADNIDPANINEVKILAQGFITMLLGTSNGTYKAGVNILIRLGCFLSYFVQAGTFPNDSIRIADLKTGDEEPLLLVVSEEK